jgi:outer membrane protein assembly factor BamB
MRLQATLFLVASCVPSAFAIYADEVGHIDYHHALLGVPSSQSTFFHRPSSSSNAALLYTLSENSLLGAVNPKDGSLLWRQNLSRPGVTPDRDAQGLLRASGGKNAVVSALGDYVSAWSALDGKLIWESSSPGMPVVDLELLELEDASSAPLVTDAIALSGGHAGSVRRLDGSTGEVKWEYHDESGDVPFQVSASSTAVFYISLQPALLKGYKIRVTSLDPLTGRQASQQILNSDSDVSGPDSVLFVGANTAFPVIAWADKSHRTLKVNVIGTKQVTQVNIENTSGEDIRSIYIHAPKALNALPHFLVQYETASGSWAEVYHVDLASSTVSKAYSLPFLQGWSVFSTGTKDANVYFTRVTDSETTVASSVSHGIIGRWTQHPPLDRAVHAVSEVAMKGDSVAVRSAIVLESGDWQLIQNGAVGWTRPEALSGALAACWADVDSQQDLAHQLEVEGHESLLKAYTHRVKRHLKDLEHLPNWLKELPKRVITSILADEVSNLDSFGVSKPVIIATKNGWVYALDSGNHGKVAWSVKAAEADTWNVKSIQTQPGLATVHVADGSSITLNVTTGRITHTSPATDKLSSEVNTSPDVYTVTQEDGRILGWSSKDSRVPVWTFQPAPGEKIIRATARPPHDPVASIGKVLGNRSVLYKYLTPNAALVTAVGENWATFYLLDGVTGRILHTSTHKGVDTAQPIASAMSENWFAYSFYAEGTDPSEPKGYQLVVSEMYESPIPNDRGPLGSASNYSSIADLPLPHVISQSFIISEPISYMAVTQTRQGITTRQLLATLPESNAIIGIPRPVLDPRRPVGRDPTPTETEEGLMKYAPFLDFDGRWYLSHARQVAGINTVLSAPTLLESTSLIFGFGNDIFATRATPSQAFDILGKGFSKLQLLLTIVALAIGVSMLAPMARKKKNDTLWKAR